MATAAGACHRERPHDSQWPATDHAAVGIRLTSMWCMSSVAEEMMNSWHLMNFKSWVAHVLRAAAASCIQQFVWLIAIHFTLSPSAGPPLGMLSLGALQCVRRLATQAAASAASPLRCMQTSACAGAASQQLLLQWERLCPVWVDLIRVSDLQAGVCLRWCIAEQDCGGPCSACTAHSAPSSACRTAARHQRCYDSRVDLKCGCQSSRQTF